VIVGFGSIRTGTVVQPLQSVKPIVMVCVHRLWAVLISVILLDSFLVLLLFPECVSRPEAVEMWG
jgi:hypothetical protein